MSARFDFLDPGLIQPFPALHIDIKGRQNRQIDGKFKIIEFRHQMTSFLVGCQDLSGNMLDGIQRGNCLGGGKFLDWSGSA